MATDEQMCKAREAMAWPHSHMVKMGMLEGLTEGEAVKLAREIINAETESEKAEREKAAIEAEETERKLYAIAGVEYRPHTLGNNLREAAGLDPHRKSFAGETPSQRAKRIGRERAEQDPEYKRLREMAGLK